jgi:hypothetical protein
MDAIVFHPGRSWFARLFGRSPLVRSSDRVEAVVQLVAVLIVLLAAPVAAAVGTAVHSSLSAAYVAQLQTRHTVTATVLQEGEAAMRPYGATFSVGASWQDHGVTHQGSFAWDRPAKVGGQLTVWVNDKGEYAGSLQRTTQAVAEAVAAGVGLWMSVVTLAAATIGLVGSRLDRRRGAAWDRGLRTLVDGDGGRTNTEH